MWATKDWIHPIKIHEKSTFEDSCCKIDIIDHCVKEWPFEPHLPDGMEECLIGSDDLKK